MRVLNDFLVGRPWDVPAFHQVGAMWLVAGEPELAIPPLEGAVARAPDFVDARLALGQALGQLGRVEESLSQLEAASTTDPGRFEAPYLAAAVLDGAGRLSEAVDKAARAVELAPRDAGMRRFLGRLLLRIEHWPEAQAELERALQLGYREDPAIFADLGAALLGQERLPAARAAYERHLELAPDDAETLLQLGYLDWRANEYEASEEFLERAIALDPSLRRAHHFLGLTALRRQEFDRAEEAFRRALDQGEDFPEGWLNLGKIALRRGDAEECGAFAGDRDPLRPGLCRRLLPAFLRPAAARGPGGGGGRPRAVRGTQAGAGRVARVAAVSVSYPSGHRRVDGRGS